ncbi:MAG TPA: MFS transporter [Gemmatimonadaceae bacterium]|nr:MFS transporter [Gemmatimonadaceae bacterium]
MAIEKRSPTDIAGGTTYVSSVPGEEMAAELPEAGRSGFRWTICALLFAATTINYVDRQVIGILAPTLQRELGWTEVQYGQIVSWFSLAYGIGFLGMGRLLDRIGVRRGFAISIVAWSIAAMAHAVARTAAGFSAARALLGLGESGNFPGSIKAVAEWFPKKERALATGIFNAGSNVGAVLAPLLVPWITLRWGWQWAFIATGAIGFIWLISWLTLYRDPGSHPRVSRAELAYIRSDPVERTEEIPWPRLLKQRQTWAFALGKFMTDPIWLFYLFWLPKFLDANWGIKLSHLALPLIIIYVLADIGSVAGGWFSGALMARGWTVNRARKVAMLVAALCIVPTMFAAHARSVWVAVAIVSVAAAAHQWWSCNLFTLTSDMFPKQAVASVVGIGGFVGAIGAVLFQRATGRILQATGSNYSIIFVICGLAYVAAWFVIHLLVPRMRPVQRDALE